MYKVNPCGLQQIENVHKKKKMAEKYKSLVLCQLERAGPTKFSNFKIGQEVKSWEKNNQIFDDIIFCYTYIEEYLFQRQDSNLENHSSQIDRWPNNDKPLYQLSYFALYILFLNWYMMK